MLEKGFFITTPSQKWSFVIHNSHAVSSFRSRRSKVSRAQHCFFVVAAGMVSIRPISAYRNWSRLTHPDDGTRPVLRGSAVRLACPGMTIGADLRDVVKQIGCRSLRLVQTEPDLTLMEKGAFLYWDFYAYRLINGRLISSTRNK